MTEQNQSRNNIARFNTDGSVDTSFTIQAGGDWLDSMGGQTINKNTEVNVLTREATGNILVRGILTGDFGAGQRTWVGRLFNGQSTACLPGQVANTSPCECVSDCNGDGSVFGNEVTKAVNIVAGADLSTCPEADANGDGDVFGNEVTIGVNNVANGCPGAQ